jgi:GntR family transcriptional regulator, transcriptional repressor for pyruvate dehydrogenase complex
MAIMSDDKSVIHQRSDLRPLPGGRVAERVVEELRGYIADNQLQPGDKLPPERVFLEQLKVSRSSLREAIRVLSTLGVVDVRHGDGMYVTAAPDQWEVGRSIFDATEEHGLRNLVETRMGIEIAAVTAATQRASGEDLDRLQQLIDDQARHLDGDRDYAWEPLGFELAMIEVTGNTWLYEVEIILRDAWLSLSGGLRATVGRYGEWHSEHRAILASIRSRNVPQAQRLVMAHLSLERFEEDLRALRTGGTSRPKDGHTTKRRGR